MARTSIPIKKVYSSPRFFSVFVQPIFFGAFVVGILLGALLRGITLPPLVQNPASQLGAVAESSPAQSLAVPNVSTTNTASQPETTDSSTGAVSNDGGASTGPTQTELDRARINSLTIFVSGHESAIARLDDQIARIKDESVALISEFTQNCGSWQDDCAKPYQSKLEVNNATYNDLEKQVVAMTLELKNAQIDLADISGQ